MLHSPERGDRNRLPLQILQPPATASVSGGACKIPCKSLGRFCCGCNLDPFLPQKESKLSKPKIYGTNYISTMDFRFSILGDVKLTVEIFVELVVRFLCLLSLKILQPEPSGKPSGFLNDGIFSTFNHGISLRVFRIAWLQSLDPGLHSLVLRLTALARSASG